MLRCIRIHCQYLTWFRMVSGDVGKHEVIFNKGSWQAWGNLKLDTQEKLSNDNANGVWVELLNLYSSYSWESSATVDLQVFGPGGAPKRASANATPPSWQIDLQQHSRRGLTKVMVGIDAQYDALVGTSPRPQTELCYELWSALLQGVLHQTPMPTLCQGSLGANVHGQLLLKLYEWITLPPHYVYESSKGSDQFTETCTGRNICATTYIYIYSEIVVQKCIYILKSLCIHMEIYTPIYITYIFSNDNANQSNSQRLNIM